MYTKNDLMNHIAAIGIKDDDTLLIHSSMNALGEVDGGAETVLDAFIEYLKDGLLIFPTHTWDQIQKDNDVFNPAMTPSCVGILGNLFMKRPGVIRSWHPTHSVAALGKDAESYIKGDELCDSPCSRQGCMGQLYDRRAKILFLGCSLKKNTYIHGVEEWNHIPNRLTKEYTNFKIATPDGQLLDRPMYRHSSPVPDISQNYDKLEQPLLYLGIGKKGFIGDAVSYLCDAVEMADMTGSLLKHNPDLFLDDSPVPKEWYIHE